MTEKSKKKEKKENTKKKQRLQFGVSFVQKGGAFTEPLENTGELFLLLSIPGLCGNQPKPGEESGIGGSAGNAFSQRRKRKYWNRWSFFRLFSSLHKHRRKHLDFSLQKPAKIHKCRARDIQEKERREGRGEDVR